MPNSTELMLSDFVVELSRLLDVANLPDDEFSRGRRLGLMEVASLMVDQARAFKLEDEAWIQSLISRHDLM